ncbi:MAG: hypothetical protein NTV31_00485 [Bacteroidia bacterium]|nr:hypothetical protein [Bacteroidia bacterium]
MINKITLSLLAFILFSFVVKAQVPSKGQVLWLQAGNLQKVDATGALSNWDDASGNKNHATQTLKNFKPLLIKNGMGNQPVVRFDGANDYLNCPSNFPTSSYTIVTLIKVRDFGAYNSIVGGTTSRIYWFGGNSTPQLYHNGSLIYSGKRFFPMNGAILTTVVDDSAKLVSVYYNDTLVLQQKDSIPNIDKGMQIGAFNKGWGVQH